VYWSKSPPVARFASISLIYFLVYLYSILSYTYSCSVVGISSALLAGGSEGCCCCVDKDGAAFVSSENAWFLSSVGRSGFIGTEKGCWVVATPSITDAGCNSGTAKGALVSIYIGWASCFDGETPAVWFVTAIELGYTIAGLCLSGVTCKAAAWLSLMLSSPSITEL